MWAKNTLSLFRLDTCKWGHVLNDRRVKWEVVELKESEPLTWVQDRGKGPPSINPLRTQQRADTKVQVQGYGWVQISHRDLINKLNCAHTLSLSLMGFVAMHNVGSSLRVWWPKVEELELLG